MAQAIISTVVIIVVVWGSHVAARKQAWLPWVIQNEGTMRKHFGTAEASDTETAHFIDITW